MSFVLMKMTEQGPTPRGMRREFNQVSRSAFETMGTHWHTKIRGKHFTAAGASEYDYRERSKGYQRFKRRKYGHNLPLVLTGQSRRATNIGRIVATKNGVRVSMSAPRLNWSRGLTKPREELTRISIRDKNTLVNVGDRALGTGFKNIKKRRTTRLT